MGVIEYATGILFVYATGALSALGMKSDKSFDFQKYVKNRKKTWLDPPDIAFSIVWPILYTLEGIVLGGLLIDPNWILINMFVIQTLISASWTWIFFRWNEKRIALDVLVCSVACSILLACFMWKEFYRTQVWLFLPYILWCSFACILNYMNLDH